MRVPYSQFVPFHEGFPHKDLSEAARICQDGDILVEVGAFLGHGVCYMTEGLALLGKRPKLYAIDTWDEPDSLCQGAVRRPDMPWGEPLSDWRARGGRLYESFRFYVDGSPHRDYLYDHVQFPPGSCMDEFAEDSVSFVFLNYSQDEGAINQEVQKWWVKLKSGGQLLIGATPTHPVRSIQKS